MKHNIALPLAAFLIVAAFIPAIVADYSKKPEQSKTTKSGEALDKVLKIRLQMMSMDSLFILVEQSRSLDDIKAKVQSAKQEQADMLVKAWGEYKTALKREGESK
jgi:hypothetical protein